MGKGESTEGELTTTTSRWNWTTRPTIVVEIGTLFGQLKGQSRNAGSRTDRPVMRKRWRNPSILVKSVN